MLESMFDYIIGFLLCFEFICIIYALFKSKGRFEEYITPLNKKEYSLKKLLPIGLYILQKINYRYSTKYDQIIFRKVSLVYGSRYAQYYMQMHLANKIVYIILAIVISTFYGLLIEDTWNYFIFLLFAPVIVFFLNDKMLDEKSQNRVLSIKLEFPDYVNKLTLLIGAGMTVRNAWEKIVEDSKRNTPLYMELRQVVTDLKSGTPEVDAYQDFADRIKIKEISNFIGVIVQNLKLGGSRTLYELKSLGNECWEMRKNTARQLGEKASAKLVFPMMIMFLAVLIVVMTPAILAFKGI